jgi:hypothetical protein
MRGDGGIGCPEAIGRKARRRRQVELRREEMNAAGEWRGGGFWFLLLLLLDRWMWFGWGRMNLGGGEGLFCGIF